MALGASRDGVAAPLTRDTITPLLIADVNALQANRYFVQSMLDFNSTPFTVGYGTQQARVDFARIDGKTVPGSLSKDQLVLSLGFGRPATELAGYAVLNFAGATAGDFPRPPISNQNSIDIRATQASVFAALGVAYKGYVLQYGVHVNQLRVHSDQLGRLTHCGDQGYCADLGYPTRAGAPGQIVLDTNTVSGTSHMLMFESLQGYSAALLLAGFESRFVGTSPSSSLAALRLMAQPEEVAEWLGFVAGAGLNTYAKELDYYGDKAKATEDALLAGVTPPRRKHGIAEIPLVAERLFGLGLTARVVGQVYPRVLPRLAEVGYLLDGNEIHDFVPNVGARAKVFRRGKEAQLGMDAYAGFFWVTTRSTSSTEGRGMSLFATYSYNSPDASNFVPLPNAHVFGAQLVWGNPAALAPPVPSVRVPESARYQGGEEL